MRTTAVRADGAALAYAAPELQADREVVLQAVRADGAALAYAAPELQADVEVVYAAVRCGGAACTCVHGHAGLATVHGSA